MREARFSQFSIPHSPFSILHFPFSIPHSPFVSLGLSCLLALSLACTPTREAAGPTTAPAQPHRFDAQIDKFEEEDRQNPPPQGAVLFIGSSSIRG